MLQSIALYKFMYQGNINLYLERKKDKFELFLSLKNKENKVKPNNDFRQALSAIMI